MQHYPRVDSQFRPRLGVSFCCGKAAAIEPKIEKKKKKKRKGDARKKSGGGWRLAWIKRKRGGGEKRGEEEKNVGWYDEK